MHRLLRGLVCFLLICALLVNLSPIRAEASVTATAVLVSAWPVIKSAIIGLGVVGITDALLYEIMDSLTSAGIVDSDGNMEVYSLGDGLFGVSELFLEWLHGLLFSSGIISSSTESFYTALSSGQQIVIPGSTFKYYIDTSTELVWYSYSYPYGSGTAFCGGAFMIAPTSFKVYIDRGSGFTYYDSSDYLTSANVHYFKLSNSKSSSQSGFSSFKADCAGFLDIGPILSGSSFQIADFISYVGSILAEGSITSPDGLELGVVAPPGSLFFNGYPEWAQNSVELTDDNGESFYVAPIGSIAVDTPADDVTQEDTWIGTPPIIIVIPDVDVGDNPDPPESSEPTEPSDPTVPAPIPGDPVTPTLLDRLFGNVGTKLDDIKTLLDQLLDKIGNGGSGDGTGDGSGSGGSPGGSWSPPSGHQQFALGDLSKFFPFCIPFDLYAFFQLLDAEPEAPEFSWEIRDLSGHVASLTIDLSDWDSVAQLFRRLQLFLFICGLAAASRKFIKW